MPLDAARADLTLAVVGAGVMGRGIAQLLAQAGIRVLLHDARAGAADEARREVARQFERLVEKARMTREDAARAAARIEIAGALGAVSAAQAVIEAIVENLDAKRALFAELEAVVAGDCLLATNTSSLSVTAIASACRRPE